MILPFLISLLIGYELLIASSESCLSFIVFRGFRLWKWSGRLERIESYYIPLLEVHNYKFRTSSGESQSDLPQKIQ